MKLYEDMLTVDRKQLQADSNAKFARIFKKSVKVLFCRPYKPCRYNGFQHCWRDIVEAWDEQVPEISYRLFYAVIYRIAWNRYPVQIDDREVRELLELIEEAILEEGYAYTMWAKEPSFQAALTAVRDTTLISSPDCICKSEWFGRYIYAGAYCRIGLKNRVAKEPFDGLRVEDMEMFATVSRARAIPVIFREAVKYMVPEAVSWTRNEWLDEAFIIQEVQKACSLEQMPDYLAFDAAIDMYDLEIRQSIRATIVRDKSAA